MYLYMLFQNNTYLKEGQEVLFCKKVYFSSPGAPDLNRGGRDGGFSALEGRAALSLRAVPAPGPQEARPEQQLPHGVVTVLHPTTAALFLVLTRDTFQSCPARYSISFPNYVCLLCSPPPHVPQGPDPGPDMVWSVTCAVRGRRHC